MRLAYLAVDRPELQYVSKEAARVMHRPNTAGMQLLKRAARFLKSYPRTVARYDRQPIRGCIDVFTDTDHAGCTQTRKSTSSVVIKHGGHWIKSTSTTQAVIGLSSGESEFHGIVKGTSHGLGMQLVATDLGRELELRIWCDASAGMGIAQRRGVGKIRHLHAPLLWVQRVFHERRAELKKIKGTCNPADLGTKVLSGVDLWKCLLLMGFREKSGRSRLALEAS